VQDYTSENRDRIDVTVFWCDKNNETAARTLAAKLPRDKVGQIKVDEWPSTQTPTAAAMRGTTTIFHDPNEVEVAKLVASAAGASPMPKLTPNPGPPTRWRVSAVVCS
jgi:hypothetical protein